MGVDSANIPKPIPENAANPLLTLSLQLRPELAISRHVAEGNQHYLIEDGVRGKYFQLGELEARIASAFQTRATPAYVLEQLNGQIGIDENLVVDVAKWLIQNGLAISLQTDPVTRLKDQNRALRKQKLLSYLNPISLRLPLFNPDRMLSRLEPVGNVLFGRLGWTVWVLVLLYAVWQALALREEIGAAYAGTFAPSEWLVLLVVWAGLKILHECGHGLACKRFGGNVGQAGVSFILFTPLAYVDVTSSWRFRQRWHRIVTAFAGMYFELFIAALAFIAWSWLPESNAFRSTLYKVFLTASLTTLLFNANPLMKFDGYYILSDAMAIPNLYTKGQSWFNGWVGCILLGMPAPSQPLQRNEAAWIATFGILSAAWRVLISISLIIGASVLFHGAGIVLAVIAIIFWYGLPAIKFLVSVRTANDRRVSLPRLVTVCTATAGILVSAFTIIPGPGNKSAPAVVQFERELPLRAASDSFVEEILVVDGEAVVSGQPLVVLKNESLDREITDLIAQVEQSERRCRKSLQNNELANYQAESKSLEELKVQLSERSDARERLTISAPFDGIVLGRELESMLGQFVASGDVVLTVANADSREIVVSIAQTDLAHLQTKTSAQFRAVFPGTPVIRCSLKRLNTQASMVPVHRALCADAGGALPVRPVSHRSAEEESVEFLAPRITLELSPTDTAASSLKSGQTGTVVFSAQHSSMGAYLFVFGREWLEHKFKQAMGEL
ncbi:MAG: efflux RND transporter periplasmic adaptor subunit [Pirellulaceae bacterium]